MIYTYTLHCEFTKCYFNIILNHYVYGFVFRTYSLHSAATVGVFIIGLAHAFDEI